MTTLSLTDPVNGTTVDASLHATNNAAIKTVVNGNIDNNNIKASAGIAISKLSGFPSDITQRLRGDGTWAVDGGAYRKTTVKAVNTTVSATDLLNAEVTIAANAMGATGVLRLTAWGDWKNNSGGTAAPPRFQVTFGGTTLVDSGTSSSVTANVATRYGWRLCLEIFNQATNAQWTSLTGSVAADISTAGSALFTTGEGTYATFGVSTAGFLNLVGVNGATAVDTTSAQALVLNVINGSANANYETKLVGALVEIV